VICRREGTFASYSAARRMRRVTASSHLTSASVSGPVSGPAAPPAFPYARPCTGSSPRREFADCAQHRLLQRAGLLPYRGCRRGSTQARSEWHSRHRKAAHGLPVVLATGVAARKPRFPPGAATGRASETRRVSVTPAARHSMQPHRRSRQRAASWTPRRGQLTQRIWIRIGGLGPARLMLPITGTAFSSAGDERAYRHVRQCVQVDAVDIHRRSSRSTRPRLVGSRPATSTALVPRDLRRRRAVVR
jgi:hypothetical protein